MAACAVGAVSMSGAVFAADDPGTPPVGPSQTTPEKGVVLLDYQALKVDGYQSIDLVGFHYLNKFNDWLYLGVGGLAPLIKGDYGGFMAFDTTIQVEQRLSGKLSAVAGASLGGGAGGRTTQQSKVLAGTGGFLKTYVGLGYRIDDVTIGVDYSRIRLTHSAINSSQLGIYVQLPVTYSIAPYADAGRVYAKGGGAEAGASNPSDDDVLVFGTDNVLQLSPKGSNGRTINLVDVQYDHFLTRNYYALFGGSVGYHGIAGYNQAYGGFGYRYRYSKRVDVNLQLAVGSGGYSPEKIDTGSGLLVYPKLSAEYRFSDYFGLALSGGYLFAPHGSSRNLTLGASLVYHADDKIARGDPQVSALANRGHRVNTFLQTEFKVNIGDRYQSQVKLLTVQVDSLLSDRVYVPIQGSIAYDTYLGYPGYGEVLAGLGVQTRYADGDRVQPFAQLLAGTNIHGLIVKPALGLNLTVNDRFAAYAQAGSTLSLDSVGLYPKQYRLRAWSAGLGFTYRFSLPG